MSTSKPFADVTIEEQIVFLDRIHQVSDSAEADSTSGWQRGQPRLAYVGVAPATDAQE